MYGIYSASQSEYKERSNRKSMQNEDRVREYHLRLNDPVADVPLYMQVELMLQIVTCILFQPFVMFIRSLLMETVAQNASII